MHGEAENRGKNARGKRGALPRRHDILVIFSLEGLVVVDLHRVSADVGTFPHRGDRIVGELDLQNVTRRGA